MGIEVRVFHPESLVLLIQHADGSNPLDPEIAGPARNDSAQRKTVFYGQCVTIHAVGEKSAGMKSLLYGNRPLEVCHRAEGDVSPVQENLYCSRLHTGPLQQIRQADTTPPAISGRSIGPLQSSNRRIIHGAAVPGAFQHANQLV